MHPDGLRAPKEHMPGAPLLSSPRERLLSHLIEMDYAENVASEVNSEAPGWTDEGTSKASGQGGSPWGCQQHLGLER